MVKVETYVTDEFKVDWALKIEGLNEERTYYGRWYDTGGFGFFSIPKNSKELTKIIGRRMEEILDIDISFPITRENFNDLVEDIKWRWCNIEGLFE